MAKPQAEHPGPQTIIMRTFRDGAATWEALASGLVDVAYECPYEVIKLSARSGIVDGVRVRTCPSLSINMLVFNTVESAARSRGLRRRAAAAIDPAAVLARAHQGVGQVPRGPVAPCSRFERANDGHNRPDAAGPGGRPTLGLVAEAAYNPVAIDMLCHQLAEAGIACRPELLPPGELIKRLRLRQFDMALVGAAVSDDPDIFLTECFHSRGRSNYSGIRDKVVDDALLQARTTLDPQRRLQAYQRAVARLSHLVPAVYLRNGASVVASRPHVHGLRPHPDHLLRLEDVHLRDDSALAGSRRRDRTPAA
ncbi:ABC transporter substrate-binding protein [Catellatospora coxensis]